MKLYCLQCKQFQFVGSKLFGQAWRAVFSPLASGEIFFRAKMAQPLEKLARTPNMLVDTHPGILHHDRAGLLLSNARVSPVRQAAEE